MVVKSFSQNVIDPTVAALPPDVRRAYGPPSVLEVIGASPQGLGQRPNEGHSPSLMKLFTARHSLASHPAAEPNRSKLHVDS